MKHRSPKQLRKKKINPYILDNQFDATLTTIDIGRGSRVDKLPPYEKYNPNRIHVARRRRAYKDHHTFPRGWTWADKNSGAAATYDPTSLLEDYFFVDIRENNG